MSLARFDGMKIYPLASKAGLVAWLDYLPVKQESDGRAGSYDNEGYFTASEVLASATGLVAWVDYIPVFVEAGATTPWSTESTGFIPFHDVTA